MIRSHVHILALVPGLLVALVALQGPLTTHAASAPKPTETPVPTQTPYATYTPYPSPTATHRAALLLSATSGLANTGIVAAGTDFPPNTTVTLSWDNDAHILATGETDGTGAVRLDLTIPGDATPGGHEIRAMGADHTDAIALFTVPVQGYQSGNTTHYCTGLFGWCPDLGGFIGAVGSVVGELLNSLVVAIFSPIEHMFSDEFAKLIAPFQHDLTYTPDIPKETSWGALRNVQVSLQELAGVCFFGFIVVGVFARYLEQLGVGDFAQLTSPVRRAVVVTGLIAGYPQLMGFGFAALNTATSTINGLSLAAHETGWEAVRGAIFALHDALSFQGVLDVLVMLAAYIMTILSVVVRDFGLGALGGLYIVGPLALATFVSPYFEVIARSWAKIFIAIALWPLGYSLWLKVIALMFTGGGPMSEYGGLSAALGAFGMVLLLYKNPAIVGSFVGAAGAVIGAVASSVTDAGIDTIVASGRRAISSFLPTP